LFQKTYKKIGNPEKHKGGYFKRAMMKKEATPKNTKGLVSKDT
jgi:hypothetical protein